MNFLKDIVTYLCNRYFTDYAELMSEMKLHKLLYLIQCESHVETNEISGNPNERLYKDDIREDAPRMRLRRFLRSQYSLIC